MVPPFNSSTKAFWSWPEPEPFTSIVLACTHNLIIPNCLTQQVFANNVELPLQKERWGDFCRNCPASGETWPAKANTDKWSLPSITSCVFCLSVARQINRPPYSPPWFFWTLFALVWSSLSCPPKGLLLIPADLYTPHRFSEEVLTLSASLALNLHPTPSEFWTLELWAPTNPDLLTTWKCQGAAVQYLSKLSHLSLSMNLSPPAGVYEKK